MTTVPGRIDFFTDPITLAGGPILLVGDVRINDDMIVEALEYFVVILTSDNVPPLTESNGSNIIRIDNGGEFTVNVYIIVDIITVYNYIDILFLEKISPNSNYQRRQQCH